MQSPSRVVALVLNSVTRDSRVCKEADGLAGDGHEVTVIGLVDKTDSRVNDVRDSGARIRRIELSGWMVQRRYRRHANVSLLVTAGLVAGLFVIVFFSFGLSLDAIVGGVIDRIGVSGAILSVMIGALAIWSARRSIRYRSFARKKASALRPGTPHSEPVFDRDHVIGSVMRFLSGAAARGRFEVSGVLRVLKRIRANDLYLSRFLPELARLAPDVVHCHDLPTLPVGAEWCRRHSSVKLVFDSHELYEEVASLSSPERWYWRRKLRRLSGNVDAFITVNESIAAEHARRYPALPRAVVVRNAAVRPSSDPESRGLLRAAAKVRDDQRVLLYQGGYARHRGLEALLFASVELPPEWVVVMMGWGAHEARLRTIALDVDPLGDRIRFLPPAAPEVLRDWTAGADLGVIPYENTCLNHWFCSPNKLWEYPVAGVPILASPFPELRREIEGAGIGCLLPEVLDGPGLRRVVDSIDDEALMRMRAACREYARRDHWGVYLERLLGLYRRLDSAPNRVCEAEVKPAAAVMMDPMPSPAEGGAG